MTSADSIQLAAFRRKADTVMACAFGAFVVVVLLCLATLAVYGTYRVIAGAPDLDAVCVEAMRYSGCVKWQKL